MFYVKYEIEGKVELEKHLVSVDDANTIHFLCKDLIAIANSVQPPVFTKLADIEEVSKYRYRHSVVGGALLGAAGGAIVGAILGYVIAGDGEDDNVPYSGGLKEKANQDIGAVTGAFIGSFAGALIGAVITDAINKATLHLISFPDNEKKRN